MGTKKYDLLSNNNTFRVSNYSGLQDLDKYTMDVFD